MESTLTPVQAHDAISKAAKEACPEIRVIAAIAIGEHARQGDIYCQRIKSASKEWKSSTNKQLAPGTSQGSRHIVSGDAKVFVSPEARPVSRTDKAVRLLGPQIVSKEGFTITHPEHAHMTFPAGIYQISYQLDWSQQRAVRD